MSLSDSRIAKCPKCDHILLVRLNQLGRRVACTKCKFVFQLEEQNTYVAVASSDPSNSKRPDVAGDQGEPATTPTSNLPAVRRAKITARFDYPPDRVFTAGLQGIRACNCDLIEFDQSNNRVRFSFFVNGRITEHQAYVFEASEEESEFEIISNEPNVSQMFDAFYEALVHATEKNLKRTRALSRRIEADEATIQVNVDARQYGNDDEYSFRRRRTRKPPGGIAVAGFVCGLVGLVLVCLPGFAIVLGILGIVFGCLGLNSRQHGLAVAGLSLGIIAVLFALIILAALTAAERRRYWSEASTVQVVQFQSSRIA